MLLGVRAEKNMNKKKAVIISSTILAFVLIIGYGFWRKLPLSEYEKNVNKITEIDYSKQQEALNAIVEEGQMNVNYMPEAVFKGLISEKFNVKNIKNNHYPIKFEIYDEDGNCVYVSKKIEPGYEINRIELNKELEKGTHKCKLKIGYEQEGNVSSEFPIKIEVR